MQSAVWKVGHGFDVHSMEPMDLPQRVEARRANDRCKDGVAPLSEPVAEVWRALAPKAVCASLVAISPLAATARHVSRKPIVQIGAAIDGRELVAPPVARVIEGAQDYWPVRQRLERKQELSNGRHRLKYEASYGLQPCNALCHTTRL